jgi:hypothetical protein
MKVSIQTRSNQHGINGTPVTIKQIIDGQAVIVTPAGKKAFVDVADIKAFHGEVVFNPDGSAELTPDPEAGEDTPAVAQPAPLFPNLDAVAADEDDAPEALATTDDIQELTEAAPKKSNKGLTVGAARDNY